MMKRSFLLPLVVAGLMMTMALSLNSCKKTEKDSDLNSIPTAETPVYGEPTRGFICPYCGADLPYGTVDHTHYFDPNGTLPPPGPVPDGWIFPVDHCLEAYEPDEHGDVEVCPYSGQLHDNPLAIEATKAEYLGAFGIVLNDEEANILLLPRYHRHVITYRLFGNPHGTVNQWHVGGGTSH